MNKKANMVAIIYAVVVLFVFFIIIVIGGQAYKPVAISINETGLLDNATAINLNNTTDNWDSFWDNMFFFGFMISWLMLLSMVWLFSDVPQLAIPFILLSIGFLVVPPVLGIVADSIFNTTLVDPLVYKKTNFIFDNYLVFGIAIMISSTIVMYTKGRLA